jgi:trehalose synthase
MHEVPVVPRPGDGFAQLVSSDRLERYRAAVAQVRARLGDRTLWHVNSTAEGGGVAELLRSCLGYLREDGIDTRWLVFQGDPPFFDMTKRIHNRLHGDLGDGGPLGPEERERYESVARHNLEIATSFINEGDVVVVHDPQPLGLVPGLVAYGATVIWTCHVGIDTENDVSRSAWDFLRGYLATAHAYTFTRSAYVWEELDEGRVALIPPCIDGLSLKNIDLEPTQRESILGAAAVVEPAIDGLPTFVRGDLAVGTVVNRADMVEEAPVPAGAPLVLQVSRWDRLKDPFGVLQSFSEGGGMDHAHLMLAGPAPSSVADDPEAKVVLTEMRAAWDALRPDVRPRVHLANIPTEDAEENAVIVNALQRRADVVVQKSLAEGFGLTVTEAMWKARPMVASRVGGIQDQIDDGTSGLLVDPRDLTAFGNGVRDLLQDPARAASMGAAAREHVRDRYLAPDYLRAYLELIVRLEASAP